MDRPTLPLSPSLSSSSRGGVEEMEQVRGGEVFGSSLALIEADKTQPYQQAAAASTAQKRNLGYCRFTQCDFTHCPNWNYVAHHSSANKQRVVEEQMENYILYEELGTGTSSIVYKGRRRGNLNYVAIICTDKAKRPEITNHILLDGSGILKFGNFCQSRAEGETLEDFFSQLSTSEEAGERDGKENSDNMRKRLQGSPTYSAPELFQGADTSMSSDLWALGMDWPELLNHSFWAPLLMEGEEKEDEGEGVEGYEENYPILDRRVGKERRVEGQAKAEDDPKLTGTQQISYMLQPHKSFTLVEKLQSLNCDEWNVFLLQLCSSLEEQNPSTLLSSSVAAAPASTATRSKLNLLCYLCCVAGHKAVSTLTDLLRDNLRNNKVKQFLLPPLGEFLYLIASQANTEAREKGIGIVVQEDGSTGGRGGHRAKESMVVEVVTERKRQKDQWERGRRWQESLSRLTRVVPAVFLAVIDTCGSVAILECVGGAGARVQQHLLTAMASALVASRIQTHRVTQTRDLVLKVLRCLESPSTVTRAKALLLLLLLIQDNSHTLLYCCQQRLVMYLERDLRKARPLRENPGAAVCEEMIRTTLSIVEVLSQHQGLITPHRRAVVDAILPPLTTLAFSRNAVDRHRKGRLIKHSRILPTVFQLIVANRSNVTSGMVQNAVALLCNLSGDTTLDLETLHQQGLIEVIVETLSEAAVVRLDAEGHAIRKSRHLVLQALLELLHNMLKQTIVASSALKVQTTDRSDWLECPEGVELESMLQDIAASNRSDVDVASLAAEILQISGSIN
ncbi:hypothetical protein INR49_012834 [Caranx melampygus]|nr:hypothetical protein INR49_012834 [Caranx melampygus]